MPQVHFAACKAQQVCHLASQKEACHLLEGTASTSPVFACRQPQAFSGWHGPACAQHMRVSGPVLRVHLCQVLQLVALEAPCFAKQQYLQGSVLLPVELPEELVHSSACMVLAFAQTLYAAVPWVAEHLSEAEHAQTQQPVGLESSHAALARSEKQVQAHQAKRHSAAVERTARTAFAVLRSLLPPLAW